MKKILLASSVLALTAAAAHAQALRIGGEGRLGVQFNSAGWGPGRNAGSDWRTEQRLRLNFSVAVEGDNGLMFGAFARAQMQNEATGVFSGSRVYVEAAGLRVTFGNQDGAIASIGYTGSRSLGYTGGTFAGSFGYAIGTGVHEFSSAGGGVSRLVSVRYDIGDFAVMLSSDRHTTSPAAGHHEVALRYSFDAFTVAAGTTASRSVGAVSQNVATVSGNYNGGDWQVGLIATRVQNGAGPGNNATGVALTGQVNVAGGTAAAFVGRRSGGGNSTTDFGVSYRYSLGGGATLGIGVERYGSGPAPLVSGYVPGNDVTRGELGIVFSF